MMLNTNQVKNPFRNKPDKVLIEYTTVPKNVLLKLRIRFTHSSDALLKNAKYGKLISPSRMSVNQMGPDNIYLSSSPQIDFPFNLRSFDGKFDATKTIYLAPVHINALKQTLIFMRNSFTDKDLFYLMNNNLCIDESICKKYAQAIPLRGIMFDIHHCLIREPIYGKQNEYSIYEGVRIINQELQVVAEMTVDELDGFIHTLDTINITDLMMQATQLGISLLQISHDFLNEMNIPLNQKL